MSDFSTTALLEIELEGVREARQTIEDELATVDLDLSGSSLSRQTSSPPRMMPGGSGSGSGGRAGMRLAESQTELLEDAVIYLNSIDDHFDDGLLGGGGGGLAGELLGIGGDFASEGAGAAADAVSGIATDAIGTAIGSAAGDMIAQQISGSTVELEPTPVPIESPDGGGGDRTLSPTINTETELSPTFEPTIDVSPELDLPDLEFGGGVESVRVDESQLPLPVDRDPLQVDAPDAIPVDAPDAIPIAPGTSGGGGTPESPSRDSRSFREVLGDAGSDAAEGALVGGAGGAVAGSAVGGVGAVPGAALGGLTGASGAFGLEFLQAGMSRIDRAGDSRSDDRTRSPRSTTAENNVDADVRPQFTINVDTDRLIDDVERLVKDAQDEVRDELLDEIRQLERDLDDLERGLTSGRR